MARIAVVNDDTVFLTLMGELLRDEGWDAEIIREGDVAYEQIKREQPDVVVLDLLLDEPDTGWRVLEMLTLDPATRHIPIIVCSAALEEMRLREDWLAEHGIETLLKPFDIEDLYARVREALGEGARSSADGEKPQAHRL